MLIGWRETTVDADLKLDPEPAGVFEAIARLKDSLDINVELSAPDVSEVDASTPWLEWTAGPAAEVLRPEREWEGAALPLVPSVRSLAPGPVNEVRDPAIFEEDGHAYLLYAVAGESGLGIAELVD